MMAFRVFLFAFVVAAIATPWPSNQNSVVDVAGKRNFLFFGINESGPEFGEKNFTGVKNKEYVWPELSTADAFIGKGMNTFRINILAERGVKGKDQKGPFNEPYIEDLKKTVQSYTDRGQYAMIVPHNYGRWYGKINTDVDAFQVYWKNLASLFKDNDKVVFDTNNEFHDMPQPLTVKLNQAAINGIRAAGATTQYITVEGNSWSGAWTWTSSGNGATMGSLTDPSDKLLYQMHQYLDIDGSGTHEACVSSTIGVERLRDATAWLKKNKKVGIIGEFAGGDNPVCKKAITGMLEYMVENKDVWQGAIWWAAGPWWGKYMFDMEPNKGIAWKAYMDLIARYA